MIQAFGREYVPVAMHSLGGLQLALFAHKRKMLHRLDYVSVGDVACGVGNVFHNKGAIAAFVKTSNQGSGGDRRIMFVSSHLAAHASKVDDRNSNYWRILAELEEQVPPRFLLGRKQPIQKASRNDLSSSSLLLNSLDYVFWGGDLNYRIDLPREFVEHNVLDILKNNDNDNVDEFDQKSFDELLSHDQLAGVIARGDAFNSFCEGKIISTNYMTSLMICMAKNDY